MLFKLVVLNMCRKRVKYTIKKPLSDACVHRPTSTHGMN